MSGTSGGARGSGDGGGFEPKLIYLARRHPALSRAEFIARWRRHGALGMSLPRWRNVSRYVHRDVLDPPRSEGLLAPDYDGIGIVWHRSPGARRAHLADRSSREQMERDELETFAEPVVNFCLVAREEVLVAEAEPGGAPIKLHRFLRARDRRAAAAVAADCRRSAAGMRDRLRARGAGPLAHVVNVPLPPERGDRWGLDADCIEELWFEDVESAVRAARTLADAPDGRCAAGYELDVIAVLTTEVLLHEG